MSKCLSLNRMIRHIIVVFLLAWVSVYAVNAVAASACGGVCKQSATAAKAAKPAGADASCAATNGTGAKCMCPIVGAYPRDWVCDNPQAVYGWAQGFLKNFLSPFYTLIIATSRIIGIFLIFWGLMRLRRMGHHHMMHRISPMATTMFFVVGAIFAGFMPEIMLFSGAVFNGLPDMGSGYTGANHHLMAQCSVVSGSPIGLPGGIQQHSYCPILAYYQDLNNDASGSFQTSPQQTVMQVIYALLLVVGVISFLRGCLFLLRLGEGNMQDGSMAKAITHIIAGIIGINAHDFQILMAGLIPHNIFT